MTAAVLILAGAVGIGIIGLVWYGRRFWGWL